MIYRTKNKPIVTMKIVKEGVIKNIKVLTEASMTILSSKNDIFGKPLKEIDSLLISF